MILFIGYFKIVDQSIFSSYNSANKFDTDTKIMKTNTHLDKIAYFSMEYGLETDIKTYCGGLGILAGDTVKSAADLNLDFVSIGILYKSGWFKQVIDPELGQRELPDIWDYREKLTLRPETFIIEIADEDVTVQIWEYKIHGVQGKVNSLFFLDADLPQNSLVARRMNQSVYPSDDEVWLRQEILLGYGGYKALQTLGMVEFDVFHLNESHAMSLVLALKSELGSWAEVRQKLCFTTHTPLKAAHQNVDRKTLERILNQDLYNQIPANLWEDGKINFTSLCIFGAKYTNGVAKRHMETTTEMYPESHIDSITNGVHHIAWASDSTSDLFDKYLNNWRTHPENLRLAKQIPSEEIIAAHQQSKSELIDVVNKHVSQKFKKDVFTIGFARRAVPYKRASLIFTEIDKLSQIAKKFGGLQLVFAGKTSPTYDAGKEIVKQVVETTGASNEDLKIVYLPDYSMDLGLKMTSGVDLWLNNPMPPLEASGTSGMKAALNGVPSFSILDGWWPEGWIEGITGWSIGIDLCEGDHCREDEIADLYYKLDKIILPTYQDKKAWAEISKSCISINGGYFHTSRMLMEYVVKGYLKNMD